MKEKYKYLKTIVSVLFLSLVFSGVISQSVRGDIAIPDVTNTHVARSDIAGGGLIAAMALLPLLIVIGVIIAVIWIISFIVIKKLKKKNDHDIK